MTAANSDKNAELVAAVNELRGVVVTTASSMETFRESTTATVRELRGSNKRHRIAITLAAFGLVLDLGLSGVFLYQHFQQNCINDRSHDFIAADKAKVRGQIAGIDKIIPTDGSTPAPRQGVLDFKAASLHFIVVADGLPQC